MSTEQLRELVEELLALLSYKDDGKVIDSLRSHLGELQVQLAQDQAYENGEVDGRREAAPASLAGQASDQLVDFLE